MKRYIYKILCSIFLIAVILLILTIKSNAATLSVTPSTNTVQPGQKFNITISVSGGAGYATISASNATLGKTSTSFLDNSSETITCTAGNTNGATITISASATLGDYKTEKDETKKASTSITIKKKETTSTTKKPTTKPTVTTTTTKKQTTTNVTSNKTTTTKKEEKKKDDFYITKIALKGVKENNEKVNIELSPKFNKKVYEYSCKIPSDVKKIEVEKNAGDYTKNIRVSTPKELKEGENTITLKLEQKGQTTRTYKIKAEKEVAIVEKNNEEEKQENKEIDNQTNENVQEENKQVAMISMPLSAFIAMQIGIIIVELLIIYCIYWKKFKRKSKHIVEK